MGAVDVAVRIKLGTHATSIHIDYFLDRGRVLSTLNIVEMRRNAAGSCLDYPANHACICMDAADGGHAHVVARFLHLDAFHQIPCLISSNN
jgi:hypothetical protein